MARRRQSGRQRPLNETQLAVLEHYKLEEREFEVRDPKGRLVKVTHMIKVYPKLQDMDVRILDLIPTTRLSF